MSKTVYYKDKVLQDVIVLAIDNNRRNALRSAVENVINNIYGEKKKYADGCYRYPWERESYVDMLKRIDGLKDSDDEVMFFGGFFYCAKFALTKYADQDAACAEMLQEIREQMQE